MKIPSFSDFFLINLNVELSWRSSGVENFKMFQNSSQNAFIKSFPADKITKFLRCEFICRIAIKVSKFLKTYEDDFI